MDKVILIPSVIVGLIFVGIYSLRCWKNGHEFNHGVLINSIFQASGIVCGMFLIIGTFMPDLKQKMTGIDIYIFVGGLAVLSCSTQSYWRDAITATKSVETEDIEVVTEEADTSP